MKLYIVRHGETNWNKEGRLQGNADIVLNENGRKLARIVGENMKDIPIHIAISSPLSRAVETAQLLLRDRNISLILDDRIREMHFGEWEGLRLGKEYSEIPADRIHCFFYDTEHYIAPEHGESFQMVIERTHEFYEELLSNAENEEKNILISTHGAASRALLQSVFCDGNFWQTGVPKNCAVTIVEIKNGKVVQVYLDHMFYE